MEYISLAIRSIFIDNMIFAFFLGMCSYLAVSKDIKTSLGLGIAVAFMLVITVPINYLLQNYVLKPGALSWLGESFKDIDLSVFTVLLFIVVLATITQLVEMVIEKFMPALYSSLGIFLPLIAVNCAIFAGSLFMQQKQLQSIGHAAVFGLGSGIGWCLAILSLAAIREKLEYSDIPKPLRGFGMALIITGLTAIGFMSFSGIKI